jgi:predicted secreted Zn-dependent protease
MKKSARLSRTLLLSFADEVGNSIIRAHKGTQVHKDPQIKKSCRLTAQSLNRILKYQQLAAHTRKFDNGTAAGMNQKGNRLLL